MKIEVKFKSLTPLSKIPRYAHEGDAGLDLIAVGVEPVGRGAVVTYHTGLACAIPEGYVGLIFPRSSICNKDLILSNCVGVVDSGYRGEILVKFRSTDPWNCQGYALGDKIAQLVIMPCPSVDVVEVEDLDETERGEGGFGSSGE